MAAAKGGGSSFLGGLGSSFLTGAGAAIGSSMFGSKSRSLESQYRLSRHHYKKMDQLQRERVGPNMLAEMRAKMAALQDAGLHPLAALGMSMSSGPNIPMPNVVPGQSDTGSYVGEGIRAAMAHRADKQSRAHAQTIAGLQLEEQGLRNEWVREQIRNSQIKRAQILSNAAQGSGSRNTPGPGPQESGNVVLSEHASIPTGKTTSSQDAEDRYWEIGGAGMGLHNLGYDAMGSHLGTVDDELKRLEQAGIIKPFGYTKKNPLRWRKSKTYGEFRYTRKPYKRPKYPTYRRRDYSYDYQVSP